MKRIIVTLVSLILAGPAGAQDTNADQSVIGVKLRFSLSQLENLLDQNIPRQISQPPARHVCVPAERACTKIPEFRGFKIYSRMECIDATPRITCDISGQATREGNFQLTGNGSTLTARQVIRASVTARGRGDIGRNIRQTARGAMEVSLATTPRLSSDWTLNSNADISYRWIERPAVRLFNVIPVTIGGEVEGTLNPQIAMIENGGADAALAELELKARMQEFWDAARQPVELDLGPGVDPLYLHLQPQGIAASNLSFANGRGELSLQLFGRTMVTNQGASPWPVRKGLPNLGTLPGGASDFRIKVPVRLDWGTVNRLLSSELPITLPLEQPFAGKITVRSASILWSDGAFRIALGVEVAPESQVLSNVSGTFTLRAQPSFDAAEQTLRFDEIALVGSSTPALKAIVSLAQTLTLIEDEVSVPLADKITGLERDLRRRLISDPVKGMNGITRSGNVTVGFDTLQTAPAGLTFSARAEGNLTLNLQVTP